MPAVRYQAVGADTLARTTRACADDLDDLGPELAAGIARAADDARRRAPRRRGRLAGSIGSRRAGNEAAELVVGVPYGGVIDFGWRARGIEPQPYAWAAFVDRRAEIIEGVAVGVRRRVARIRGA